MVKRKKELWVRTANAIALRPDAVRLLPRGASRPRMWALPFAAFFLFSMRVVGRRRRHPAHRGRTRIVVAGRRIPPHAGHRLGRDAVRLRRPQGPLHRLCPVRGRGRRRRAVGEEVPDDDGNALRRNRIGTTRRRRPGGASSAAPVGRTSTASSRRCRRRSAPTPRRSRRRPAAVAAVASAAAVAAAVAAEEEADHGEIPADHRAGAGGAGAGRFRDGLQQDPRRRRPGRRGAVAASTSS